jgi:hypothetical protein
MLMAIRRSRRRQPGDDRQARASPNFFALFEGDHPSKLTAHIAKQQIKAIYLAAIA